MARNIAVYGIYPTRLHAAEGVDAFKTAGFRTEDISILLSENEGTKDLAVEKHTKAPEGAITGAICGGILGAVLGWLVGSGMVTMPGVVGSPPAAGPVLLLLAGIGLCGIIGAIVGALVGVGQPEYEARRFDGRLRRGALLLSAHCDDRSWANKARRILIDTGAGGIASGQEEHADYARSDRPLPRTRPEARLGETAAAEDEQQHRAA